MDACSIASSVRGETERPHYSDASADAAKIDRLNPGSPCPFGPVCRSLRSSRQMEIPDPANGRKILDCLGLPCRAPPISPAVPESLVRPDAL